MSEYIQSYVSAVEHSITTTYRKTIWKSFVSAMKQYGMTKDKDCIAVCVSGGKDSFLLAKCLQILKRHSEINFDLRFLFMDPGYSDQHLTMVHDTAHTLGIPLHIFTTDILSIASGCSSPCHVCASMRRGYLYKEAQRIGCNKIALGHHYDDVVETVLLSMLYGGEFKTMMPMLNSSNYPGMQLIRPLYLVREKQILSWQQMHQVRSITCACPVTQREDGGKRREIKNLIGEMEKNNPNVKNSIFSSTQDVNLQTILSWKTDQSAESESILNCLSEKTSIKP